GPGGATPGRRSRPARAAHPGRNGGGPRGRRRGRGGPLGGPGPARRGDRPVRVARGRGERHQDPATPPRRRPRRRPPGRRVHGLLARGSRRELTRPPTPPRPPPLPG